MFKRFFFQSPEGDGSGGGASAGGEGAAPAAATALGGAVGKGAEGAPAAAPATGTGTGGAPATAQKITFPENWKEGLEDDLRGEESLRNIKSIGDLAKSFIHSQKMIGKNKVVLPDPKHGTEQDWREFYQKVGLPADIGEYKVDGPKDFDVDEKFLGEFKQTAHSLNILPAQAQKLLDWYINKEVSMGESATEKFKTEIDGKLAEYKRKAGDAYEKQIYMSGRLIDKFGNKGLQELMNNPAIGSNPDVIEFMYGVSKLLFEEEKIEGGDFIPGGVSPKDAQERIDELKADPKGPYWNGSHAGHKAAVAEMQRLYTIVHPGPKPSAS